MTTRPLGGVVIYTKQDKQTRFQEQSFSVQLWRSRFIFKAWALLFFDLLAWLYGQVVLAETYPRRRGRRQTAHVRMEYWHSPTEKIGRAGLIFETLPPQGPSYYIPLLDVRVTVTAIDPATREVHFSACEGDTTSGPWGHYSVVCSPRGFPLLEQDLYVEPYGLNMVRHLFGMTRLEVYDTVFNYHGRGACSVSATPDASENGV